MAREGPRAAPDPVTRRLASLALAVSLLALVLAGYAVYAQQRAEENLRAIGQELERSLAPRLPLGGPPLGLDPDDT